MGDNDADTRRIETLFHRALELNLDQQSDFISLECGENINLRHQVESLIASARAQETFDIEGLSGLEITAKHTAQGMTVIKIFMSILKQKATS